MDGESLCGLVASCLRSELARHGATLPPERFDDTLEHLIVVALTIAEKYDPARSGPGYTFSSYLWDMLKVRLIDYWRREIGDTRRRPDLAEMFAQFTRPLSWEALTRDADVGPPAADELDDDMHEAVEALAGGLSDEARETLATIVRPLAEGWRIKELASELGTSSVVVNARLRRMREELERLDAA